MWVLGKTAILEILRDRVKQIKVWDHKGPITNFSKISKIPICNFVQELLKLKTRRDRLKMTKI